MRDILTQQARKQYSYRSRYSLVPVYFNDTDKREMYGLSIPVNPDTAYVGHKVKAGDSYDSLALYYYNNPTLYWLITSFNEVVDPFSTPVVGETLRIPVLSNIEFKTQGLR